MCGHRGKAQANAGVMLVQLGTGKENAAERSAMGPDQKLREMKYKVSEFYLTLWLHLSVEPRLS